MAAADVGFAAPLLTSEKCPQVSGVGRLGQEIVATQQRTSRLREPSGRREAVPTPLHYFAGSLNGIGSPPRAR